MTLTDPQDLILARYLYDEYICKHTMHTYGDVSKHIEKVTGIPCDPHMKLPHNLGRVSEFCYMELSLPLISVGVFSQSGDIGTGFAKLARIIKPDIAHLSDSEIQKMEKTVVRSYHERGEWKRLLDFLDGKSVAQIMHAMNIAKETATFPDEEPACVPEGAKKQVTVDIRERNPEARRKCIEHYGATCVVCGFNFGKAYGDYFEGKIHVHHLKPLAKFTDEHDVNPIADLRPVCPNCHMILHCNSGDEPYTIDAVKAMFQDDSEW